MTSFWPDYSIPNSRWYLEKSRGNPIVSKIHDTRVGKMCYVHGLKAENQQIQDIDSFLPGPRWHISHHFRPLCQGCDRPYYATPFDDIFCDVSCTCIVDYLALIFFTNLTINIHSLSLSLSILTTINEEAFCDQNIWWTQILLNTIQFKWL